MPGAKIPEPAPVMAPGGGRRSWLLTGASSTTLLRVTPNSMEAQQGIRGRISIKVPYKYPLSTIPYPPSTTHHGLHGNVRGCKWYSWYSCNSATSISDMLSFGRSWSEGMVQDDLLNVKAESNRRYNFEHVSKAFVHLLDVVA